MCNIDYLFILIYNKFISKKLDLERIKFVALKLVRGIFLLLKIKYMRYSVRILALGRARGIGRIK